MCGVGVRTSCEWVLRRRAAVSHWGKEVRPDSTPAASAGSAAEQIVASSGTVLGHTVVSSAIQPRHLPMQSFFILKCLLHQLTK